MRVDKKTVGISAIASVSNKVTNQDACATFRSEEGHLAALIVADGIGSHFGSDQAANVVTEATRASFARLSADSPVCLESVFQEAHRCLQEHVEQHAEEIPSDVDWANAFGTTLLCAVDTQDRLLLGYVGNGAIIHLRGNFNTFPKSQLIPWSAMNYLNPHSLPRSGKNVLYKLLSPRSKAPAVNPTVLSLRKDNEMLGDIIVVCSDGISSYDQTPIGRDREGHIWISGEEPLELLYVVLNSFFTGELWTQDALEDMLKAYLSQLRAKDLVTDDCTLGVLLTEQVLTYQKALRASQPAA